MRRSPRSNLIRYTLALLLAVSSLLFFQYKRVEHERVEHERASLEACLARQKALHNLVCMYFFSSRVFFPHSLKYLSRQGAIRALRCPTSPDQNYEYQRFDEASAARSFAISCPGKHIGLEAGFPKCFFGSNGGPVAMTASEWQAAGLLRPTDPELRPDGGLYPGDPPIPLSRRF